MKTYPSTTAFLEKPKLGIALAALAFCILPSHSAQAATLYWGNSTASAAWQVAGNWYQEAAGTNLATTFPGVADDAIFSITSLNSTAISPVINSNTPVNSLTFDSTVAFSIIGSGGNRNMEVGAGGITMSALAAATTVGTSSANKNVFVKIQVDQTWTNNSASTFNVRNSSQASDSAAGAVVLTLNAASTGSISNSGAFSDGAAGSLGLIVDSAGTGVVSMGGGSYSGGTTVKRGVLQSSGNFGSQGVLLGDTTGTADVRLHLTGAATNSLTVQSGSSGAAYLSGSGSGDYQGNIQLSKDVSIGNIGGATTLAVSGNISGAGAVTLGRLTGATGTPTISLTGTNNYTGKTTIESATVVVNALKNQGVNSSLGASTGANSIISMGLNADSTLRYTGTGDSTDRVIEIAAARTITLEQAGTGLLEYTSNLAHAGTGARTLRLRGGTAGTGEFSGVISNNGASTTSLSKLDSGTWRLSGLNSYTGGTSLGASGVIGGVLEVEILADGGFDSSIGASTATASNLSFGGVTTAATLRYLGTGHSTNRSFIIGGIGAVLDASGSGAVNFTATGTPSYGTSNVATSLTLTGTNTGANTYAANLNNNGSGAVSITKDGVGKWVLTGTTTYTGATTVNAGTLIISGSGTINNSSGVSITGGTLDYQNNTAGLTRDVTVNGGTFKNNSTQNYTGALNFTSGTVGGSNLAGVDLNIGTWQTMSPGNSTGTLTTGATSWDNGGTFVFELNNATGTAGSTTQGWDLLDATTLDITAGASQFTLQIVSLDTLQAAGLAQNFSNGTNYSWLFADAGATITGFSAGKFVLDDSAFQNTHTGSFSVVQGTGINDDKLYLEYTAVPEPATWALLAFSLTSVMVLRRRRA